MTRPDVVVVGAGVAGLAAAVDLQHRGASVTVLEAGARIGGMCWTELKDGLLLERGPCSIGQPPRPVIEFLDRSGIWSRRIAVRPEARTRYLVDRKQLLPLPRTPGEFLRTRLLSPGGKLRMAGEAFIPAATTGNDETLADFVRRRFGDEALRQLADPFQNGIFAGDPEQLSLKHAFPRLRALEREHGSLLRAMMKGSHAAPAIWSFAGGMQELASGLAAQLSAPVETGARVRTVEHGVDGWRVERADGGVVETAAVVLAVPAHHTRVLEVHEPLVAARDTIASMATSSIVTVSLAWPASVVRHPLDGLGFLAPHAETTSILGALFSSSMFPGRAPDDVVLCTAFVGGARRPAVPALSDAELLDEAERELRVLLGVHGPTLHRSLARWPLGIPQPGLEHGNRLAAAAQLEEALPGLALAGSWRSGVGVPGAMASGLSAAARLGAAVAA